MFSLGGNYIDLIIVLVLLYFILGAWWRGFLLILADFASFLLSLLVSLRIYQIIADFLKNNFSLTKNLSDALGFLVAAIIIESIIGQIFYYLIGRLPRKIRKSKINKLLGLVPALGEGLVFVAFLITLFISLPIKPEIKGDITSSRIGSYLLTKTSSVEGVVKRIFGGIVGDSLTSFTIKTGSRESIKLESKPVTLSVDEASESQMFALVNSERKKRGVSELTWDPKLVPVARSHARDMWERNYFSHYSPEGEDVGDRLTKAGVAYSFAGENLALAPTVQTAHTGLMNSEGHRENILNTEFKKVGIGVIDNGYYGKMFVQVFTD